MKILRAQKKVDGLTITFPDVTLFDVEKTMILAGEHWLRKRIAKHNYFESFEKFGMIYPITCTDHDHHWKMQEMWPKDEHDCYIEGIACHTGQKRLLWAKDKGYTHIEGYYVISLEEKNQILLKTKIPHRQVETHAISI
tara:strand:+ start:84 stop:500 length:417 start_codon:yes stop_codon:yes gene_type:complete